MLLVMEKGGKRERDFKEFREGNGGEILRSLKASKLRRNFLV